MGHFQNSSIFSQHESLQKGFVVLGFLLIFSLVVCPVPIYKLWLNIRIPWNKNKNEFKIIKNKVHKLSAWFTLSLSSSWNLKNKNNNNTIGLYAQNITFIINSIINFLLLWIPIHVDNQGQWWSWRKIQSPHSLQWNTLKSFAILHVLHIFRK